MRLFDDGTKVLGSLPGAKYKKRRLLSNFEFMSIGRWLVKSFICKGFTKVPTLAVC